MDGNETACRYYGYGKGRDVKGVNIPGAFYTAENKYGKLQAPIDYQIIPKTKAGADWKTGKERRVSEKRGNEMTREMTERMIRKPVEFGYILAGSWFASVENMRFTAKKGKKPIFEANGDRFKALYKKRRGIGLTANIRRPYNALGNHDDSDSLRNWDNHSGGNKRSPGTLRPP
jgi:hypothetical protein